MSLAVRFTETLFRWLARRSPATRARVGRIIGTLAWPLVPRRRRIALRNIELCFPELSPREQRQLGRRHFVELAHSIVDRAILWYGTEEQVRALVALEGFHHLQEALQEGPVILLAPHFIGLDAGATRLSLEGPAASMYQVQSHPGFDALFRKGRTRFNDIRLVSRREGLRPLVRYLRQGLPIYYLPDMDFGRRSAVFVPFFGVPAATVTAPAQLARNWQARIVPVLTYRDPITGQYTTHVQAPLDDFPGDDDLTSATARLNREIEAWIRVAPSQYHWVHKRFKTQPEGWPDLYD